MALIANNITGRQTTGGTGEETLNISLDGAAAAATLSIPSGQQLTITDLAFTGEAATRFRVQQANDGVTFFDIYNWRLPNDGADTSGGFSTPLFVKGGDNVKLRVRVQTPGGAALVASTLLGRIDVF